MAKKSFTTSTQAAELFISEPTPSEPTETQQERAEPERITQPDTQEAPVQQPEQRVQIVYVYPESKTRRVNIVLKPSTYESGKAKAESQHISFNEYVHRLIDQDTQDTKED